MNLRLNEMSLSGFEKKDFSILPISDPSPDALSRFKNWRDIPVVELPTEEPKNLEVVSNVPVSGQAMAWPAYYKMVKEGLENDGNPKGFGELSQKIIENIQTSPIVKLRPELKFKLDKAQNILDSNPKTANLQLVVMDGYRRLDVQKRLFDAYLNYVITQHPKLTKENAEALARKMVSQPPSDLDVLRKSPPPHSTGGAADVVLVFKSKINTTSDYWLEDAMVPFGASFDEMMHPLYRDTRSETSFYENKLKQTNSLNPEEQEALEYRRILYHVLTDTGFTNYFTEFWHFDFGNQFNAAMTGKENAKFGFAGGIEGNQIKEDLEAEIESYTQYKLMNGPEEAQKVKHHFGL